MKMIAAAIEKMRRVHKKNTIIINGQRIETSGGSISITGGSIYVGGQKVKGELSGIVEIKFEGDLASLQSDASVTVHGNVQGEVKATGSVNCGTVWKNVDAGGSVQCGNVKGDLDAGGSVKCGNVQGNIDAGGSVRHG